MPEKLETTHVMMANELVLYQREHSNVWQCRYKVDGKWQRATTKQRDIDKAKAKARDLMIEAEVLRRMNQPFITRKFRNVAKLAIQRMDADTTAGKGMVSYKDYIRVINEYLIPFFGNYSITSVNYNVLDEFNTWRTAKMGKAPAQSTLMTQNAALNRVFDEAVIRNFLTEANRPKLESKGKASDRRPDFDMNAVRALRANFPAWIQRGRDAQGKELRNLLRDYVEVLLDTGARPGDELLNLKWNQIQFGVAKSEFKIQKMSKAGVVEESADLSPSCLMTVSGKTGMREIAGMADTVKAFARIARRNYKVDPLALNPLKGIAVATNNDFVLRTKDKSKPTSFQKLFESYLEEHNLLIDPSTGKKRVFYSLRHTYATLAITHDLMHLSTLTAQMGTSVAMIEKHYSHLKVREAIEQLRRKETQKLLDFTGVIDEAYKAKPKPSKR